MQNSWTFIEIECRNSLRVLEVKWDCVQRVSALALSYY